MTDVDRARCATAARLLEASQPLAMCGLALSVTALLLMILLLIDQQPSLALSASLGSVVLAGALERYLAFRIVFDAGLFKDLALSTISSLAALDSALADAGLRAATGPVRTLDDRLRGSRRLIRWHGLLVAGQGLAFAATLFSR